MSFSDGSHESGMHCVIYLNYLNYYSRDKMARQIKPCLKISFLAQKFLLMALYEEWDDFTVTAAAERLKVFKMSLIKAGSKKEIWDTMNSFLQTPLVRELYLEQDLSNISMKSGISGLAELSMLEDNSYPAYAVTKYEIREKGIDQERQIPCDEIPECVVYLLVVKGCG